MTRDQIAGRRAAGVVPDAVALDRRETVEEIAVGPRQQSARAELVEHAADALVDADLERARRSS